MKVLFASLKLISNAYNTFGNPSSKTLSNYYDPENACRKPSMTGKLFQKAAENKKYWRIFFVSNEGDTGKNRRMTEQGIREVFESVSIVIICE